jgi:hypothetical protein
VLELNTYSDLQKNGIKWELHKSRYDVLSFEHHAGCYIYKTCSAEGLMNSVDSPQQDDIQNILMFGCKIPGQ